MIAHLLRFAPLGLLLVGLLGPAGCQSGPTAAEPALLPARSAAGSSAAPTGYAMHHLDRDGDGRVSEAEFRHAVKRKFTELDRDGSGKIHVESECKPLFITFCRQADRNKDGHLDEQELHDHAAEHFRQADKDKDGHLTHQELTGVTVLSW